MLNRLVVRSPLAHLLNFDGDLNPFSQAFDTIKIDITENEKEYKVMADVPGVNKDNIKVEFHNDVLTIEVEAQTQNEQKEGEKVWRMERSYSRKSRSINFGKNVDESAIEAKYENGVLTLTLPKKTAEAQKAKILIQ